MNREDFPMIETGYIYLDNGATTLKPKVVIDKMNKYYLEHTGNIHRGDYDLSRKVDEMYEKSVKKAWHAWMEDFS